MPEENRSFLAFTIGVLTLLWRQAAGIVGDLEQPQEEVAEYFREIVIDVSGYGIISAHERGNRAKKYRGKCVTDNV